MSTGSQNSKKRTSSKFINETTDEVEPLVKRRVANATSQLYHDFSKHFSNIETRHIQRFFDAQFEKNNNANYSLAISAAKALMKCHENGRRENETLNQLIDDAESRRETLDQQYQRLLVFKRFVERLPDTVFRKTSAWRNSAHHPANEFLDFALLDDDESVAGDRSVSKTESVTDTRTAQSPHTVTLRRRYATRNSLTSITAVTTTTTTIALTAMSDPSAVSSPASARETRYVHEQNDGSYHHFPLMRTNSATQNIGEESDGATPFTNNLVLPNSGHGNNNNSISNSSSNNNDPANRTSSSTLDEDNSQDDLVNSTTSSTDSSTSSYSTSSASSTSSNGT